MTGIGRELPAPLYLERVVEQIRRSAEHSAAVQVFKAEVELQLGKKIKALRSDRGGEYLSQEFKDYLNMVRSMFNLTTLPLSFWDYALESAVRILNMVPTKKVDKTPYEIWHAKWRICLYMKGYPKETMGYYFYFPPENKVIVARYGDFLERDLISQEFSGRDCDLEDDHIDTLPSENTHKRDSIGDLGEPANYRAAMIDPDKVLWQGAMDEEMKSMKVNKVWIVVDRPPNAKLRLVAKGCTQTYGIDYEETFSPVADIRAIRILIAIAAYYDYEIWQMDVKTAFLNGRLDEDIYMEQPEGYVDPKFPNGVCKLQRAIYGLKQASRQWNKRFDEEIQKDLDLIPKSIYPVTVRCTRPDGGPPVLLKPGQSYQQNPGKKLHWVANIDVTVFSDAPGKAIKMIQSLRRLAITLSRLQRSVQFRDYTNDEIPPPPSSSQTPTQQTPHTVSTIQPPILKKEEYGIWAMKKNIIGHTDYLIWEVITKWEWTKLGVDSLSFDDLYNNLRVFENDAKGSTASSTSTQNVAFVSENTSSTNDVSTAYSVSNTSGQNSQYEQTSSYSLLANQSSCPQLDHEDLEQLDEFDLEEMDLKWQEDSKALVTLNGEGVRYGPVTQKEERRLCYLMACNSPSSAQTQRFVTAGGMHAVPPPMTGNYMLSGPDVEIDYSQFTYDCSVETHESLPEPTVNEPKVVNQPKVRSGAPIIKEYESDSEDEHVSQPTKEQEQPSFASTNKQVKTPRETVKNQFTHSKNPTVEKKELDMDLLQEHVLYMEVLVI
ncbi:retrotransposon protein, putative, ty1-copia subclass [Tanacetum coccineum]